MTFKKLAYKDEEYKGYAIRFTKHHGSVWAKADGITQYIGYGTTKEQAFQEAKNSLDRIKVSAFNKHWERIRSEADAWVASKRKPLNRAELDEWLREKTRGLGFTEKEFELAYNVLWQKHASDKDYYTKEYLRR